MTGNLRNQVGDKSGSPEVWGGLVLSVLKNWYNINSGGHRQDEEGGVYNKSEDVVASKGWCRHSMWAKSVGSRLIFSIRKILGNGAQRGY